MKLTRKILASVLVLAMVLMLMPAAFAAEEDNTYVLDVTTDLEAMAADTANAGREIVVNDYFTVILGEKTKIDSSDKTFEDGYVASQRLNFQGKTKVQDGTVLPAVKFTTAAAATITLWWVEGGEDNRQMVILNDAGEEVVRTEETLNKNDKCISTLFVEEAGTYYLGTPDGSNYLFKAEVVESGETNSVTELQEGINNFNEDTTFAFTAPSNGILTLTVSTASFFTTPESIADASYSINGGELIEMTRGTAEEIVLNAGDEVIIEGYANTAAKLTMAWVETAPAVTAVELQEGINTFSEDTTFAFTAPANGTLTLTVNTASFFTTPESIADASYSVNGGELTEMIRGTAEEIILNAGDEVIIEGYANTAAKLTAVWTAEPAGPDISDAIALVPNSTQNIDSNCLMSYTAPAYGALVLTPKTPDLGVPEDFIEVAYTINGEDQGYLMPGVENPVELNEGDVLVLTINMEVEFPPCTITSEWFEGGLPTDLVLGDNAVNAEKVTFTYIAPGYGALNLSLNFSAMAIKDYVELSYSINGGESVVLATGRVSNVNENINLHKGDEILITVETNKQINLVATWNLLPTPLVNGSNIVNKENVTLVYTAENDVTMTLKMTFMPIPMGNYANVSYSINGGEAVVLAKSKEVSVELKKGDALTITVETNAKTTITATWAETEIVCQHTNTKVEGAVEATCTEPGFTGNTVCADCGEKIAAGTEIAALGHAFVDGTCAACGAADPDYVKPVVNLTIGQNPINNEEITYTYTAAADGTLNLSLSISAMAIRDHLNLSYSINGGEAVVLASGRVANVNKDIALNKNDVIEITIETNLQTALVATWTDTPAA